MVARKEHSMVHAPSKSPKQLIPILSLFPMSRINIRSPRTKDRTLAMADLIFHFLM
uniref:Uncharacterized protein n=1 Tax=Arundo donax TaxID=35708 RepID=A0A0A8ZGX6_ARUDO